jgi:hypothetical protein
LNKKQILESLDDKDLGVEEEEEEEEDSSFAQKLAPKSGGVNIFIFVYVP